MKKYISIFSEDENGNTILNPNNPDAERIYNALVRIPKPILLKNKKTRKYDAFKEYVNDDGKWIREKY